MALFDDSDLDPFSDDSERRSDPHRPRLPSASSSRLRRTRRQRRQRSTRARHAPLGDGLALGDPGLASAPRLRLARHSNIRRDDVLDPDDDGRNVPVGIDRKFVLAGLLIAGTVLCLILVVFGGGGDAPDEIAQAAPPAPPPGAYIDEQAGGYYDELDPMAPVEPSAAPVYGDEAYVAYGAQPAPNDYATTQAYGPTGSSAGSQTGRSAATTAPVDPARDAFERAVASPLMAGTFAPTPAAPAVPDGLTEEQAQELAFMREVTAMIPSQATPPGVGPAAGTARRATAPTERRAPPRRRRRSSLRPHGQRWGARPRPRSSTGPPRPAPTQYDGVVQRAAPSTLALRAGTVIPAALVTGMNSDLPGTVVAQVTRNVYDSAAQRDVLVPAGTRLVGEYDDQIAYGQNRALVAWTRMLFPDGTSVELPGLPSTDRQGYAGMSDDVDRHYGRVFGSAVLLAAVGVGVELAAPDRGGFNAAPSPQEVASRQVALELSRVATELVRRGLDVEPTLRVAPGYRFYVLLARDLPFAGPYRPRPDVGRFARPPLADPRTRPLQNPHDAPPT